MKEKQQRKGFRERERERERERDSVSIFEWFWRRASPRTASR
jgi:hypothetical protein